MQRTKKGQGWGMDLVIAVSIFSIGLVAFYFYSLNAPGEAKENIESLYYDGKIIASIILSEENPLGILDNNKINETKLKNFYDLAKTSIGYNETKRSFNTNYDYYFYLNENMDIDGSPVDGIGKPEITRNSGYDDAQNLIKITRYVIYKNKPMTAYFYIWEE